MTNTMLVGDCALHGWHGRFVCPRCVEQDGHVTVHVAQAQGAGKPRRHRMIRVSASLVRRRGSGREKLREEGRCRMCLRPRGPDTLASALKDNRMFGSGSRPLTRHHLVPERFFRFQLAPTRRLRHVDANIVPLCRPCHDLVEDPDSEVRMEARRMLRRLLGQDELTFMIQVRGHEWLEASYPITMPGT